MEGKTSNESLVNRLRDAVRNDNLTEIRNIISSTKIDLNARLDLDWDHERLIHYASKHGHIDMIKELVEKGADVSVKTSKGKLALHFACEKGSIEIVRYLISITQEASLLQSCTEDGENALYFAACSGSLEILSLLQSDLQMDIDRLNQDGKTALFVAIIANNVIAVSTLCKAGANVNIGIWNKYFHPIHYICEKGRSIEILKILLNHGVDTDLHWRHGQRPLHLALKHKRTDLAKELVKAGANLFFSGELLKHGMISSTCLAAMKCPSVLSDILAHGGNPNEIHKKSGSSVLMLAVESFADKETIAALIKAGADVNYRGRKSTTPVRACKTVDQLFGFIDGGLSVPKIEREHNLSTLLFVFDPPDYSVNEYVDISELFESDLEKEQKAAKISELLSKGGNPNFHSSDSGHTPTLIQKLLAAGADPNQANKRGDYPLSTYLINQHGSETKEVVNLLLSKGADPNRPRNGNLPLRVLADRKDTDLMEILLRNGADINYLVHNNIIDFNFNTREQSLELIEFLLQNGVHINAQDKEERSLLMIALESIIESRWHRRKGLVDESAIKAIEKFILLGAEVNHKNKKGDTCLTLCCNALDTTVIMIGNMLLKYGAVPSSGLQRAVEYWKTNRKSSRTALKEFVFTLLEKGADLNEIDMSSKFPYMHKSSNAHSVLMTAVQEEWTQLCRELVTRGADVNYCDKESMTALHFACNLPGPTATQSEIVKLLVENGAKLNGASSRGSLLEIVAQKFYQNRDWRDYITEAGGGIRILNVDFRTITFLVLAGFDLQNLRSRSTCDSFLLKLCKHGFFEMAEYLLRSGYDIRYDPWLDTFEPESFQYWKVNHAYNMHTIIGIEDKARHFKRYIDNSRNPKALCTLCRLAIRKRLITVSNGSEIMSKIELLPVLEKLKAFLSLQDFIVDQENIMLFGPERLPLFTRFRRRSSDESDDDSVLTERSYGMDDDSDNIDSDEYDIHNRSIDIECEYLSN